MSLELAHLDVFKYSGAGSFTNDSDGLHMTDVCWCRNNDGFISINPDGATFYYDVVCSITSGNQFYIGWERFDANKTARSNDACVYVVNAKPSSNLVKQRYRGTVNLSTDGTNPCAFIRLRILNKWSGSDSGSEGTATIHSLSLISVQTTNVITRRGYKNGIFIADHFDEFALDKVSIQRYGNTYESTLYEY